MALRAAAPRRGARPRPGPAAPRPCGAAASRPSRPRPLPAPPCREDAPCPRPPLVPPAVRSRSPGPRRARAARRGFPVSPSPPGARAGRAFPRGREAPLALPEPCGPAALPLAVLPEVFAVASRRSSRRRLYPGPSPPCPEVPAVSEAFTAVFAAAVSCLPWVRGFAVAPRLSCWSRGVLRGPEVLTWSLRCRTRQCSACSLRPNGRGLKKTALRFLPWLRSLPRSSLQP